MPKKMIVTVQVSREVDEDQDSFDLVHDLTELFETHKPEMTYEVSAPHVEVEVQGPPLFSDMAKLDAALRNLAQRSVFALDALGIGQRTQLRALWKDLELRGINTQLDEALQEKIAKLRAVRDHLADIGGVVDSLRGTDRTLTQALEAIDEILP